MSENNRILKNKFPSLRGEVQPFLIYYWGGQCIVLLGSSKTIPTILWRTVLLYFLGWLRVVGVANYTLVTYLTWLIPFIQMRTTKSNVSVSSAASPSKNGEDVVDEDITAEAPNTIFHIQKERLFVRENLLKGKQFNRIYRNFRLV